MRGCVIYHAFTLVVCFLGLIVKPNMYKGEQDRTGIYALRLESCLLSSYSFFRVS